MARVDYINDPAGPPANSVVPSVVAVVENDHGQVLLIHKTDNNLWALPGGGLLLAILALVLSVVSLLWQVASHVLSGDRVTVTEGTSLPLSGRDYLPDCRSITAANRGRTAVTVTSTAIDVGRSQAAQIGMYLVTEMSDPLPTRLEPGTSASWSFPISVDEEIQRSNPRSRAMVRLATGRTRYAKRR